MALDAITGSGASLSTNFYLRKFYTSNRAARTASTRSSFKNSELSLADGMALRRAIKSLGSFEYEKANDADIRNGVLAYISTYNNTISSLSKSDDRTLNRNMKQLKSLTEEYSHELDKIGITINKDGTLTSRDSLFKSANLSKFEKLFSKDSDYMQKVSAYGKRIERCSEVLCYAERTAALKPNTTAADDTTPVAELVAEAIDLDMLLNTGVGKNVNISL